MLLLFTLDVILKDADVLQQQGTLWKAIHGGHAQFLQVIRQTCGLANEDTVK